MAFGAREHLIIDWCLQRDVRLDHRNRKHNRPIKQCRNLAKVGDRNDRCLDVADTDRSDSARHNPANAHRSKESHMRSLRGPTLARVARDLWSKKDILALCGELFSEYGNNVAVNAFGRRMILSCDPDVMHDLFVRNATNIEQWDAGAFSVLLGEGLLTAEGEVWKNQRRRVQPALSPKAYSHHAENIAHVCERHAARYSVLTYLDSDDAMSALSLEIATSSIFSADAAMVGTTFEASLATLNDALEASFRSAPLPAWLPVSRNRVIRRETQNLRSAVGELIRKRRASSQRSGDLLDAILEAHPDGTGDAQERCIDETLTMLLASHETTARLLSWTCYLLATHSHIQTSLRDELRGLAPNDPMVLGSDALDHILLESMRLYPPVWGIGRVACKDVRLGGINVPRRTTVFAIPFHSHRSAQAFENADSFDPARWQAHPIKSLRKGVYLPFGAGPRKCAGMHFAMMSAKSALHAIVSALHLSYSGPSPEVSTSVTLKPKRSIKLHIAPVS